jgi:hypothetical protein
VLHLGSQEGLSEEVIAEPVTGRSGKGRFPKEVRDESDVSKKNK